MILNKYTNRLLFYAPLIMHLSANEVIRGEWGNEAKLKQKLTEAGYDYSEIQRKVNQLIK